MNADIQWTPFVADGLLWALAAAGIGVIALALWRRSYGFLWRGLFLLLLAVLLANPVARRDERQALPDKALIVVDESGSQKIAGRDKTAQAALADIEAKMKAQGIEPVVIRAPQKSDPRRGETTEVFSYLRDSLMTLPAAQMAGTVIITDGQVHDAPATAGDLGPLSRLGPFHIVLTGREDERDRKVTVLNAPKYGLIGGEVKMQVRIDDLRNEQGAGVAPLEIWQDGEKKETRSLVTGTVEDIALTLAHPGQNVIEFRTPVLDGELTGANNTAPVIVNAVRDRLRVLLVSGMPHMGERAWRNLLKSDPGIDLVHFTILRLPTSADPAQMNELSLIVFPVDELFNTKINDFDLIIFDKYQQYGLMTPQYFANLRGYIRNGGAFLMATGSDRVDNAIFSTALADSLPVRPAGGDILTGPFRPGLSDMGRRHPVTADLPDPAGWGEWMTQLPLSQSRGRALMTGQNGAPLLVVDEVEKGRVAVVSSDNLWLWAKGGDAAGPYNDLLRNLSHWLMKEPELEEGYLKAEARGRVITVSMRDMGKGTAGVTMALPDGTTQDVLLQEPQGNWLTARIEAAQNGIYSFTSGAQKAFVVVGTAQSEEYAAVETTPARLQAAADATGGGVYWYPHQTDIDVRLVDADARRLSGDGWLGLRRREAYAVTSVQTRQMVGNPLFLLLAAGGMALVWALEAGRRLRRK